MNEKVYAFIAWDDEDDEKVIFLCKTQELAEKVQDIYSKHGCSWWDHTKIREMTLHETLEQSWFTPGSHKNPGNDSV